MPQTPRGRPPRPTMRQRSLRLPSDTLTALDRLAEERGQSTNTLAARLLEEGLRTERHPLVYFRDAAGGRRPAVVGSRLDVWRVLDTVRAHDGSVAEAAEYLSQPEAKVRAAVRYYADYRDEIDAWAERERERAAREEAAFRAEASLA